MKIILKVLLSVCIVLFLRIWGEWKSNHWKWYKIDIINFSISAENFIGFEDKCIKTNENSVDGIHESMNIFNLLLNDNASGDSNNADDNSTHQGDIETNCTDQKDLELRSSTLSDLSENVRHKSPNNVLK